MRGSSLASCDTIHLRCTSPRAPANRVCTSSRRTSPGVLRACTMLGADAATNRLASAVMIQASMDMRRATSGATSGVGGCIALDLLARGSDETPLGAGSSDPTRPLARHGARAVYGRAIGGIWTELECMGRCPARTRRGGNGSASRRRQVGVAWSSRGELGFRMGNPVYCAPHRSCELGRLREHTLREHTRG